MPKRMSRRQPKIHEPLKDGTLKRTLLRDNFLDQAEDTRSRVIELELITKTNEALEREYVRAGRQQVFDGWAQQNVAASQTDVTLARFGYSDVPLMRAVDGNITRIELASSEARTAGECTVEIWISGSGTGFVAVLSEEDDQVSFELASIEEHTYSGGDSIELKVTTDGAWAPATADIWCTIHLSET